MALSNPPIQATRDVASTPLAPSVPTPRTPQESAPQRTVTAIEVPQALVAEEFSPEQIREIAGAFGEAVGIINKGLRFEIDEESHQVITQVIDRETDEVVRQIPPQELLDISDRLRSFVGTLLDQQG